MNRLLDAEAGYREGPSLTPKLHQPSENRTRRILELETIVAGLRTALEDAEAALERERLRPPEIGDFVLCPLTNFFGQVSKVTPRPHGRPWVEIIPYLTSDFRGHAPMDLYDSWELIDPPMDHLEFPSPEILSPESHAPRLPSTSSFQWPPQAATAREVVDEDEKLADDLELLMNDLLSDLHHEARQ